MKIEEHKNIILAIINAVKNDNIGEVTKNLSTLSEDYGKISALNESLSSSNNELNEKIKKIQQDNLDLYIKCSGLENKNKSNENNKPPTEEQTKELSEDEAFAKLRDDKGNLL